MGRGRPSFWTEERLDALRRFILAGHTRAEAAREFEISPQCASRGAMRLCMEFRRGHAGRLRYRCSAWEKAKQLADAGIWLSEAARQLGVHHSTAWYISRKMGFQWPRKPLHVKRTTKRLRKPGLAKTRYSAVTLSRIERMMKLAERSQ
jgi:transposase-like protein